MDLRTAYEITLFNIDWTVYLFIAVTIIISSIFWKEKNKKKFFIFWYCGWLLIAGVGITFAIKDHFQHLQWLNKGYYEVIEGPVTDFIPMPYTGHQLESFSVNGVNFEYSDYVINGGFNKTSSHGGPIYEGRWVRISYKDGIILKLVVKTPEDKQSGVSEVN